MNRSQLAALGFAVVLGGTALPASATPSTGRPSTSAPTGTVAAAAAAPAALGPLAARRCQTPWGSTPKRTTSQLTQDAITGLHAGRHRCFDRLVVDITGRTDTPGYTVRYVSAVTDDGSGDELPLRGGARLEIQLAAPGHDSAYRPTYQPRDRAEAVRVNDFRTFRQVRWTGTFEGVSQIGLGVRARLPMRAMLLRSGDAQRLVIDVAHTW